MNCLLQRCSMMTRYSMETEVSFSTYTQVNSEFMKERKLTRKWIPIPPSPKPAISCLLHWPIYKTGETFPRGKIINSVFWFNQWIKCSKTVASLWPGRNYILGLTIHFHSFFRSPLKYSLLPVDNTISFLALPLNCDSSDFLFVSE